MIVRPPELLFLEELVLTTDLKTLRRLFQKNVMKAKEELEQSNERIFDQKHGLKNCLKNVFRLHFAEELYMPFVYYSLSWLKLAQKKKSKGGL